MNLEEKDTDSNRRQLKKNEKKKEDNWKKIIKHPSTDECINKNNIHHTKEYYSAIKRNGVQGISWQFSERTPHFHCIGTSSIPGWRLRSHKPRFAQQKEGREWSTDTWYTISMNLKNILNERSRTKATYYMISLTGNIHNKRDKKSLCLPGT